MNKEVLKAISKKEKKTSNLKKWWNKNNYKVYRVLFFYIYLPSVAYEKIKKYIHKQIVWSEERATEILNYYIPRSSEWDDEKKEFFFFDMQILPYLIFHHLFYYLCMQLFLMLLHIFY